jgi:hypothetical protein
MKTFASPLQLLSLLSNSSSFADTKKKENNEIEQARKRAYELGERHHMQARLKIPN